MSEVSRLQIQYINFSSATSLLDPSYISVSETFGKTMGLLIFDHFLTFVRQCYTICSRSTFRIKDAYLVCGDVSQSLNFFLITASIINYCVTKLPAWSEDSEI